MKTLCVVKSKLKPASAVSMLLVFFVFVGTAHAVLRAYTYMGTVLEKDPENMTITIQTEYTPGSDGWQDDSNVLEGVVPNEDAINEINVGDEVMATSLGEPGGGWITLGRITSKTISRGKIGPETEKTITDIYGDPGYIWDIPLSAGYSLAYDNMPDCAACSGCNCVASYTTITVTDEHGNSETYELYPEETSRYLDRGRPVDITFISGEAPSYPTCSDSPCFGPQAVSNFVIHITDDSAAGNGDSCFIGASAKTLGW